MGEGKGLLDGIKILDISHQYAGALAAGLLCDYGADVVQIEDPEKGSPMRSMLPKKDIYSAWYKYGHRGKKCVSLKLSSEKGREIFLKMVPQFDVIVENFRPGTLEKWKIGPADLEAAGANVILLRISGFGQSGPYKNNVAYGTVAEAMSGFAYLQGEPDGPPMFTSATLADGVTGTYGALGVLACLVNRCRTKEEAKGVEVVDAALVEAMLRLHTPTMLPLLSMTGQIKHRIGNFLGTHGSLRDVYESKDGLFFITAAIGEIVVRRYMEALGAQDLVDMIDNGVAKVPQEWTDFLRKCNERIKAFAAIHTFEEISKFCSEASIACQLIYNAQDVANDPHYNARGDIVRIEDPDIQGTFIMPGIVPKFSRHPLTVTKAGGGAIGQDNKEVYGESLHLNDAQLEALKNEGVI